MSALPDAIGRGRRAEGDDDGRRQVAFVAHAEREVLDAAPRREDRGLAVQHERTASRRLSPHFDGAPVGPPGARLQRLDGGFLGGEAGRETGGRNGYRARLDSRPLRAA